MSKRNYLRKIVLALGMAFIMLFPMTSSAFGFWGPTPKQWREYGFWYRLRDSFKIRHHIYDKRVEKQIHWFETHQNYLDHLLKKAAPYMYFVFTQVKKRNLPGELVLMPIVESAYDPFAYSDRGAAGLWQLMPGTASGYGLKEDWWYDGRRDIYASTHAALDYLTYLSQFFNGNWLYAMAAYDAGAGTVQDAIEYNAHHDYDTSYFDLYLPRETAAYVPRILALAAIIKDPHAYGIHLPVVKDGPSFDAVNVGSQIDLATAAKLADISLKKLYELNPGYNRWATDPNGPYRIVLPINKVKHFKYELSRLPKGKRVTWHRYRVKPGDSLDSIAKKFHTRVALLQEINKLYSNIIHPGELLLIPRNTNSLVHYDFSPELNYANARQLKLGPKRINVRVKKGESLWEIAMKYQVKVSQIRFWNHLSEHQPLKVGQRLIIWAQAHTSLPDSFHTKHYSLYRDYKVRSGDTLDSIAKRYRTNVKKIKYVNHLKSNLLSIGQVLKIPPSEKAVFTKRHESKKKTKVRSIHYTVKAGDTLDSIAKKYATSAKIIKDSNHLKTDLLNIGEKLIIPHEKNLIVAKKHHTKKANKIDIIHYTVKPGDTLDSIAKKYHVTVKHLTKWNKAFLGKYLQPGQILAIYQSA